MARVSIIIPTYNRANLLPRAVRSILRQSYQDFEIIIVDDASTDDTEGVIRKMYDKRIVYIKIETNSGAAAARNVGLQMATGEYIAFQDSDDESLHSRLQQEVNVLDTLMPPVGIVYSNMYRIRKNGDKYIFKSPHIDFDNGNLYPASLGYSLKNIGIGTSMVRKDEATKAGLFDEDLDCFEDLEFFIRLSKICRFAHIREPLLNYYEEEPDMEKIAKMAEARKKILMKYYDEIMIDKKLHAFHLFHIGNDLCYSGNIIEGRRLIGKSVTVYPIDFMHILGFIASFTSPDIYRYMVDLKNRLFN